MSGQLGCRCSSFQAPLFSEYHYWRWNPNSQRGSNWSVLRLLAHSHTPASGANIGCYAFYFLGKRSAPDAD
ncbi:unnamed protein product [Nesidiocoris tenuis]|uniref:Uncharacterized protein n=1 Tax=Nesidiocoris tenuis TaxID=355587 RepID=A0A6H5GME8_9HEMI|nr:unnamed protein product [Nesidiocoris tenuis]